MTFISRKSVLNREPNVVCLAFQPYQVCSRNLVFDMISSRNVLKCTNKYVQKWPAIWHHNRAPAGELRTPSTRFQHIRIVITGHLPVSRGWSTLLTMIYSFTHSSVVSSIEKNYNSYSRTELGGSLDFMFWLHWHLIGNLVVAYVRIYMSSINV